MPKEWIVSEEDLGMDGAYFSYTEVVRCKNCDYHYEQPRGFSPICELTRSRAEKEGFCAWGKRKEDAKEE